MSDWYHTMSPILLTQYFQVCHPHIHGPFIPQLDSSRVELKGHLETSPSPTLAYVTFFSIDLSTLLTFAPQTLNGLGQYHSSGTGGSYFNVSCLATHCTHWPNPNPTSVHPPTQHDVLLLLLSCARHAKQYSTLDIVFASAMLVPLPPFDTPSTRTHSHSSKQTGHSSSQVQ
jgi:hypothetical protein